MPTDPATLIAEANCFNCYPGAGTIALMKLALLRQIVITLNPMADTSPQALLAQANCYRCYQGMEPLLELALLAQIAGGGGTGGGSVQVIVGDGPPVGLQPGQLANRGAIYLDRLEGYAQYTWDQNLNGGAGGWT